MSATGENVYLYIDRDDTADSVYTKLRPLVTQSSMIGFTTLSRHLDYDEHVHPGRYAIKKGASAFSLIRDLRNGNQEPLMMTIPTVRTLSDLAKRLDGKLLTDSTEYMALFSDSVKIANYGHTKETLPALFIPDTYDFFWTDDAEKVLQRMQKAYDQFWTDNRKNKAKAIGLTPIEVSILASIVDSETNYDPEKPKIAGMYLNRLNRGIMLQACPTVIFAHQDFTMRRVLNKHLTIDSPYNTYKYPGLPPGPIRIPTKAGIDAVLNPDHNDYLFICANPEFNGTHLFAKTPAEHERNAKAYQQALNKRKIKK